MSKNSGTKCFSSGDITLQVINFSFLPGVHYKRFVICFCFSSVLPLFYFNSNISLKGYAEKKGGLFAMTLIVTPGSELTCESWEGYDQAGHLWNTGLHCLNDFHMEKSLMCDFFFSIFIWKISLGVHPQSCHHLGRTKPHAVTLHRSMCKAQSHIWQTCFIHVRDSSHSYFYSMPSEKKWCSIGQNGTSGGHCPEHLHRACKTQVLGSLPMENLTPSWRWPYAMGQALPLPEAVTLQRIVIISKNVLVK